MLGKTSGEVFVLLLFISDLHFCWCSPHCFSTSFLTHPSVDYHYRWGFYTPFYTFSPANWRLILDTFIYRWGFYTQFYTFSPANWRLILDTFICSTILFLPRALRPWMGHLLYYPQTFFTSFSLTDIFKHRPGPSVCLIHSNPPPLYSERFSFKFCHILAQITCGSSLIYLLLTHFELFSLVQSYMYRPLKNTLSKTKL